MAFLAAFVIGQLGGDDAVDFYGDVAALGRQLEVGPLAFFVGALFCHFGGRLVDPAPAAGLVQAAGFVGFIDLDLKAVDADSALHAVDSEVKSAVSVEHTELGLHHEVLKSFLGEQDAVTAFAFRAGADDDAVFHLPFAARGGFPAFEIFAVEEWLEFGIGRLCGDTSNKEQPEDEPEGESIFHVRTPRG